MRWLSETEVRRHMIDKAEIDEHVGGIVGMVAKLQHWKEYELLGWFFSKENDCVFFRYALKEVGTPKEGHFPVRFLWSDDVLADVYVFLEREKGTWEN